MISQLHIILYRMAKSKSTWILLFLPMVWGCLVVLSSYLSENLFYESIILSKTDPREFLVHGILISAIFIYLLVDRERGDGGWRNKITVGVKRHYVFLGSWIVSVVFSVIASSLEILMVKTVIKLMGKEGERLFKTPDTKALILIVLWTAAFASLFVLADTYFSIRFFSLVLTLAMFYSFILIGGACKDRLDIPYTEKIYNEETDEYEVQENPKYVTGNARKALIFISDRTPQDAFYGKITKHVFKIHKETTIVLLIAGAAIGVPAFKRKEIF
ncbi:MAG: hypothetical protein K6F49_06420 [Saccharofermentans sp.]|nr:hypothetical protein [Saccharofermentans sp.]